MNLIVNAKDAISDRGSITVKTCNLKIHEKSSGDDNEITPGNYVMISVADTGAGMSEEVKQHNFIRLKR